MKIECTKQELSTMVINCKDMDGSCDGCVLNGGCLAQHTSEGMDQGWRDCSYQGRENYQYLVDKCDVVD